MDETYPGTDLLIRFCYGCQKRIETLDDCWIDVDDNCCVCTDCRNAVKDHYATEEEWLLTITPAMKWDTATINELEEG